MPWKPLRPCSHPSCPNLSDQAYCEIHRKEAVADANRRYDSNIRDKEMKDFYHSTAWIKLRALKIKMNPLCEECYKHGRLKEAVIVDHILPAKEYPNKRLSIDNLQSLCAACHNKKHGK